MIPLTVAEVADIVGGTLHDVPHPEARITGSVEFDSRKVTPGGLFVALPGARVDGADYAPQAVAAGAVGVIAARPVGVPAVVVVPGQLQETNAEAFAHDADGSVAAVVGALSALAREVVARLTRGGQLEVIGITGSAGKTSTKDFLATVLREAGPTVAPPGSFNNEIGHPYTALRCDASTRFLVAEMSARGIGHIAHLARIAPPTVGAVLNVGTAHLGEFGSREAIAKAKGELVEALPPAEEGGVAILNADDALVAGMASRTTARVCLFSAMGSPTAHYAAEDVRLDDAARASFTLVLRDVLGAEAGVGAERRYLVELRVSGAHQVSNALAAAAVAHQCGLDGAQIAAALSRHTAASAHRMEVRTTPQGATIINDSYNANPDSMRAALAALSAMAQRRRGARTWAVLGEMTELGEDSAAEHRNLGAHVAAAGVQTLVAVSGSTPGTVEAMAEAARDRGITTYGAADAEAAADLLRSRLRTGDVVLVKASHSQGLWRAAERLLESSDLADDAPSRSTIQPEDDR